MYLCVCVCWNAKYSEFYKHILMENGVTEFPIRANVNLKCVYWNGVILMKIIYVHVYEGAEKIEKYLNRYCLILRMLYVKQRVL